MLQPPPLSTDHFPAMSTECEAAPTQAMAPNPLPSASPRTASASQPPERHGSSGISYEGRVSVIPPLAGYEATMRAAMELDRAHGGDPQLGHLHADRQFGGVQMQQDLRRLYEQRVRLHEASHLYEAARQAYPPQHQLCVPKEEPVSEEGEGETSEPRGEDTTQSPGEASPQACHSQVKEEPHDGQAEAGEALAFPRQDNDAARSPINKAGESPDLPTDCARTQSADDLLYKHNDGSDRMSPYDESFQGAEERMPSSVEQDGDDTTDSMGPAADGDMDHLSRLQQAMQLSGVMSGKEGEEGKQLYQCHLCSYSCAARYQFNTHLNTHYDHKCTKCDFTTHLEPQLREHLQQEHGLSADSPEEMEGIRVPRVNAQGKVKTFKCKQCEYVAITKGDFWEHARSHIKSEKLLACPKCPFVTEYKHHLEYHLRNHFGSKPFKCNKCNYSCVNKSMLNSHMKSHSNVYQYRCSDCTYATKYCHSLKLHLRKYGHNPAMVLNPDGSPNPVPIIDVYGTRRGPKLKKDDTGMPILPPHYQIQAQLLKAQMQANTALPITNPMDAAPTKKNPARKQTPQPLIPTTAAPHSPIYSYPYPNIMDNFQTSSPILSRALEKSTEEARTLDSREHLRDLLLERERAAHLTPLSPTEGLRCTLCDFVAEGREVFSQHMMAHAAAEVREEGNASPRSPQPMDHCSGGSPDHRSLSPPRLPLFPHQAPPPPPPPPPLTSEASHMYAPLAAAHNLKEYLARAMNPFIYQQMVGGQIHPAFGLQQHLQQFTHPAFPGPRPLMPMEEDPHLHSPQPQPMPRQRSPQLKSQPPIQAPQQTLSLSPTTEGVLDLSKEQTLQQQLSMVKEQTPPQQVRDTSKEPPPLQQRSECRSSSSQSPNQSSPQSSSPPRSETSTPPAKSRRKGRAFKLERIALRLSESAEGESSGHDEDARREEEESPDKGTEGRMPPLMPLPQADPPQEEQQRVWQGAHHCQFCDMAFKDVVMYTMHMGYHGYRSPFTCNMCGHQATDKVAFFLHIARSSHS